jgi:hypothetical protein
MVSGWPELAALLEMNIGVVLAPGLYFLVRPPQGVVGPVAVVLMTSLTWMGLPRLARPAGWRTLPVALLIQSVVLLVWTHSDVLQRIFLPFLPLLCVGLATEVRRLLSLLADSFRRKQRLIQRAMAVAIGAALGTAVAGGAYAYVGYIPYIVKTEAPWQAGFTAEKQDLFAWIRQNTDPSASVVACHDAELYLYTGRQAMRPLGVLPQSLYLHDVRTWQQTRDQLLDVARYVRAQYWVVPSEDYSWLPIRDNYTRDVRALLNSQPLLFESWSGRVRLYDIKNPAGSHN